MPVLTLWVAARLYECVGPLAAAGEGAVGQPGVARDAVGRHEGADTCHAARHLMVLELQTKVHEDFTVTEKAPT